jgi:hypothetical protein
MEEVKARSTEALAGRSRLPLFVAQKLPFRLKVTPARS